MTLRIAYMGTPDFSVPALAALIEAGHEVACVYTQPPRPAGRGKKDRPSPVHAFAAERGIEVRHPASLRDSGLDPIYLDLRFAKCGTLAWWVWGRRRLDWQILPLLATLL